MQIGAQIVLGDRLVSITLARAWASLGHWERVRCLCSLLFGGLTASKRGVEDAIKNLEVRPRACGTPTGVGNVSLSRLARWAWWAPALIAGAATAGL